MNTMKIAAEYRMTKWTQIIQDRKNSGESIEGYCKNHGLSRDSYFYYQKKLREAACEQLIKIQPGLEGAGMIQGSFAEVKLLGENTPRANSEQDDRGRLSVDISGAKLTVNNAYPIDKFAYLLRELVHRC